MKKPNALDEIDRAVDRTIADKDRAERLKMALHQQYDLTRPGTLRPTRAVTEVSEEAEEFWDNVPL